jgi:hypothetical protein
MRIRVDCRDGNPRAFYLGTRWLYIMHVVERAIEPSAQRFRVKVGDGRVFVLHHNLAGGDWELASVSWHASPRHTAA